MTIKYFVTPPHQPILNIPLCDLCFLLGIFCFCMAIWVHIIEKWRKVEWKV